MDLVYLATGIACLVITPAGSSLSSPSLVDFRTFESQVYPNVGLRFVRNSGVCETTPGVNQLSGYIDFGTNMSMVSCAVAACLAIIANTI